MRLSHFNSFLLATALLTGALTSPARAQERRSPLADAPAIRKKVELRDKRFEIGAGLGSTIGQDYYHGVMVNARIGFHLTDWLAIAGVVGHNLTPRFKTSFTKELLKLPDTMGADRTPTKGEALNGMNQIGQVLAAQAEIAPFAGKFSLFGKLFMAYDFYGFGGPGFINFKSDVACPAMPMPGQSCAITGMKLGGNFGMGLRAFFNDFVAINIEARDILVRTNPAGRDENGDQYADKHDLTWDSNLMLNINATLFLPSQARVSD